MRTTIVASWALFLGIAMIMLGNGLQGSLLGLRATVEGFATATTGFVMSGYYVGFLLGSSLAPKLITSPPPMPKSPARVPASAPTAGNRSQFNVQDMNLAGIFQ